MRWALIAVLLLASLGPGCLEDVGGWIGGEDRSVEQLHAYEMDFSYTDILDPTNPPGGEEDAYLQGATSFEVPEDARDLEVFYAVVFEEPNEQLPDPPEELRQAELVLTGPGDGESSRVTTSQGDDGTWTFEEPTAGSWAVEFKLRGEGTLTITAFAAVPGEG